SFRLEHLKRERKYAVGLWWADVAGTGAEQSVGLSNTDGETEREVVAAYRLPPPEQGRHVEGPTFGIPLELRSDGRSVLSVKKAEGADRAVLGAVVLYEVDGEGG